MVSDRLSRRHLPGAVLIVAGVALAVVAGIGMYDYSQGKVHYQVSDLDGDDEGVFMYAELSDDARGAVDAALSTRENETVVDGTLGPELGSDGRYLLRYRSDYHCLFTYVEDGQTGTTVDVQRDCGWLPNSGPPVHGFQNLSDEGKSTFRTVFRDADRSVWLAEGSPPEFRSGGDAPSLNNGIYFVRYQDEVYQLDVWSGGVGVGIAMQFLLFTGMLGLVLAGVGSHSALRGRIRRPIAILVGVGVIFGPYLLPVSDPGLTAVLTRLLPAGILASIAVWGLLVWMGVE